MSDISIAAMDEKNATATLKLVANSGFRSETVGKISPRQFGELTAIIEDGPSRRKMAAADDMLAALKRVEGACAAMAEEGILARGTWGYVTAVICQAEGRPVPPYERVCDDCDFTTTEADVTSCPDPACKGTVG